MCFVFDYKRLKAQSFSSNHVVRSWINTLRGNWVWKGWWCAGGTGGTGGISVTAFWYHSLIYACNPHTGEKKSQYLDAAPTGLLLRLQRFRQKSGKMLSKHKITIRRKRRNKLDIKRRLWFKKKPPKTWIFTNTKGGWTENESGSRETQKAFTHTEAALGINGQEEEKGHFVCVSDFTR